MKEIICIVCPKGCRVKVSDDANEVSGYGCERGINYAKNEITNPVRVVTSTVVIKNALYDRCPVKTKGEIPKQRIFDVMSEIDKTKINAPVAVGDVVIKDVLGLGVDIVSTRDFEKIV